MLKAHGVDYVYREYTEHPLTKVEVRQVLKKLGVAPAAVLRKNDRACKELGLTGDETDAKLISLMAEHPTLIQRPIAVVGAAAVVGRPVEAILDLLEASGLHR